MNVLTRWSVQLAMRPALALVVLASTAGVAHADGKWEGAVGVRGGGWDSAFTAGPVDGPAIGLHLRVGRSFGQPGRAPLVSVEYDAMKVADGRGELNRVGAALRLRARARGAMMAGGYLELGAGLQSVAWEGGGRLDRKDLRIGLGVTNESGSGSFGFELGVSIGAAPPIPTGAPPTCAGPCTMATPDEARDLSVLLHLAFTTAR